MTKQLESLQSHAGEDAREKEEEVKRLAGQYEQVKEDFSTLTSRHEMLKTVVETLTRENIMVK